MSTESNRAVAYRFMNDGWGTRAGWREVWDEIVAEDVVQHFNSDPDPIVGLEANKAFNASLFEGFPGLERTTRHVVAEGDLVVYRSTLRGAHEGLFLGMAPTGNRVEIDDVTMLCVTGRQITEWWYDCNLLAAVRQLGIVELPRTG